MLTASETQEPSQEYGQLGYVCRYTLRLEKGKANKKYGTLFSLAHNFDSTSHLHEVISTTTATQAFALKLLYSHTCIDSYRRVPLVTGTQ
jgi:hypothetical protein